LTVKIKGTWKKDDKEYNGVDTDVERKAMLEKPLDRRYAVISYDVAKTETLHQDGGVQVHQIALVQIEPVDGDDLTVVREILDNRFRTRTGRGGQPSLFDSSDPDAVDAAKVLAGNLPKREVKCGALSTHPEHEGTDWVCRGLASTPGEGPTEGLSVAAAGAADSGRADIPPAPEFSDQAPDQPPARRAGGRRKNNPEG